MTTRDALRVYGFIPRWNAVACWLFGHKGKDRTFSGSDFVCDRCRRWCRPSMGA
jgi:hypothetical protein